MATYGEFIDAVQKTDIASARTLIDEWIAGATNAQWKQYRPITLTAGEVLNLAEDMARAFQERLLVTNPGGTYDVIVKDGHRFLQEIHVEAAALGIEIPIEQIDLPLTPEEIRSAGGSTATCDEFLDAVQDTELSGAKLFLGEWIRQGSALDDWDTWLSMPLTRLVVSQFVTSMADAFRRYIARCATEHRAGAIEEGHAFLREVQSKASVLGIIIPVAEIDGPLTAEEHAQDLIERDNVRIAPEPEGQLN